MLKELQQGITQGVTCRLKMVKRVRGEEEVQVDDPKAAWRAEIRREYPDCYNNWGYGEYLKGSMRNLLTAVVFGPNGKYQLSPDLYQEGWGVIQSGFLYEEPKYGHVSHTYTRWARFREGVSVGEVEWRFKS